MILLHRGGPHRSIVGPTILRCGPLRLFVLTSTGLYLSHAFPSTPVYSAPPCRANRIWRSSSVAPLVLKVGEQAGISSRAERARIFFDPHLHLCGPLHLRESLYLHRVLFRLHVAPIYLWAMGPFTTICGLFISAALLSRLLLWKYNPLRVIAVTTCFATPPSKTAAACGKKVKRKRTASFLKTGFCRRCRSGEFCSTSLDVPPDDDDTSATGPWPFHGMYVAEAAVNVIQTSSAARRLVLLTGRIVAYRCVYSSCSFTR